MLEKVVIYQLFIRLFGNRKTDMTVYGDRNENGTGKFSDINDGALQEIKKLGISHIWYTGVIEHAMVQGYPDNHIPDGNPLIIKGKAGSPYAIKDYYDVNPDLADDVNNRLHEFNKLIERTHKAGMKVIIDFVPNHLAREYHSDQSPEGIDDFGKGDDAGKYFHPNNNFYYINEELKLPDELLHKHPGSAYTEYPAKATGNNQFTAHPAINDWYETVKLNYGIDYSQDQKKHFTPIPDTWLKMLEILDYWAGKGVDGFRCDMAEMIPVEFWNWAIHKIKSSYPDALFIAEIYDAKLYSNFIHFGNFNYLYDKVGLYDTLRAIIRGEKNTSEISKCWQGLNGNDPHMLRFLENHDEQRIASKHFAGDPWKALPAMVVCTTMNKGPVMIYFGQEVGEPAEGISGFSGDDGRTSIFDYWNVPEHQKWMNNGKFDGALLSDEQQKLRNSYASLLNLANRNEAIYKGAFYDLMWYNQEMPFAEKIFAFLRFTENQVVLIVVNFDKNKVNISIKIPADALTLIGFASINKIQTDSLLLANPATSIEKANLSNPGIHVELKAYESEIMGLSGK